MQDKQLKDEAKFQDDKIKGCSKRSEAKFYHGPAASYRTEYIEKLMGDIKGLKVLDLGAGDGWNTMRMLERGASVYALDISSESIRHIDEMAAEYRARGLYNGFVMDATNMSFEDNSFDLVVGHGILHHILNYEKTIPEIRRVLKPEGRAVFNEPLGLNPIINLYRKLTPKSRTVDERPLTKEDLLTIQQAAPSLKCHFFELFTLLSKPFILLKMRRLGNKVEKWMLKPDCRVLRSRKSKMSFLQKMAWFVVLEF